MSYLKTSKIYYLFLSTSFILLLTFIRPDFVKAQNSVSVIKMNNLTFGGLVAGDSKTILPTEPGAALFQISYSGKESEKNESDKDHGYHYGWQDITVQFNLPRNLNNNAHSLPIYFTSNSAVWSKGSNIHGAKSFDPNQQIQLKLKKNQDIYIWLGGMVRTSLSQWSGKYDNVITMTVNSIDN